MDKEVQNYIDSKFEELNQNLMRYAKLISLSISATTIRASHKVSEYEAIDYASNVFDRVKKCNL